MSASRCNERSGVRALLPTGIAVAVASAYIAVGGALIAALETISAGMAGLSVFLIITTVVVTLMAALAVSTTLRTSLADRLREAGLLRALGASGVKLRRSLRRQAFIVGAAGSAVGVAVGCGLAGAAGLVASSIGAAITIAVPSLTYVAAGLAVGILVTLLGVMRPAREVGRMSPIQAIVRSRVMDADVSGMPRRKAATNVVLLASGAVLLAGASAGGLLMLLAPIGGVLLCAALTGTAPNLTENVAKYLPRPRGTTLAFAVDSLQRLPKRAGALVALIATGTALVGTLVLLIAVVIHMPFTDGGLVGALLAIIVTMMAGTGLLTATSFASASVSSLRARAGELGLLRAVGMTRRRMLTMVTLEAGIVGLVGAGAGGLIALAVVWALLMSTTATFGAAGIGMLAAVVLGATVVATMATWIPAWLRSRSAVMPAAGLAV